MREGCGRGQGPSVEARAAGPARPRTSGLTLAHPAARRRGHPAWGRGGEGRGQALQGEERGRGWTHVEAWPPRQGTATAAGPSFQASAQRSRAVEEGQR